jgi:2-oxoglutarate ferredoxin oxidoreductase subunit gamma
VAKDGMVLIDQDLVKPSDKKRDFFIYSIPATRYAEELGRKLVLNIVMFGFFTAMTGLIQKESALKAVLDSVPKGTEELNTNAFNKGYDHGIELKGKSPELAGKGKKAPARKKKAVAKK